MRYEPKQLIKAQITDWWADTVLLGIKILKWALEELQHYHNVTLNPMLKDIPPPDSTWSWANPDGSQIPYRLIPADPDLSKMWVIPGRPQTRPV